MKIYVAGPMSGYPKDNVPAFEAVGNMLEDSGHEVVLPHRIEPWQHEGDCPPGPQGESDHTGPCHLRTDIAELVTCDAIALLEGWAGSAGARLELMVAAQCGLCIYHVSYGPERTGYRMVLDSIVQIGGPFRG